jgi:hypothetical protein
VPLLVTAAIADRDQVAHDNPRGEALYHSAEQRLELKRSILAPDHATGDNSVGRGHGSRRPAVT